MVTCISAHGTNLRWQLTTRSKRSVRSLGLAKARPLGLTVSRGRF